MTDLAHNPIFAAVAADLQHVPGDHYSVAECSAFMGTARRPRNSKGRFVSKKGTK